MKSFLSTVKSIEKHLRIKINVKIYRVPGCPRRSGFQMESEYVINSGEEFAAVTSASTFLVTESTHNVEEIIKATHPKSQLSFSGVLITFLEVYTFDAPAHDTGWLLIGPSNY